MIKKLIAAIRDFLQHDLWKVQLSSFPKWKAFLYRTLRVWIIAITEFDKDKVGEKASSLTYFSLLSIVPVAAMAFGIATIFGLEEYLKEELTSFFSGQQEVLDYTLEFAERMLATSSGGLISGIGALFLIYAVARLLHNIEVAFNDIWDTKKGRTLERKMTDYVSFILLAPLLLVISSATTVFISARMESVAENLAFVQPVVLFFIQFIPYTLIWFLLSLFYLIFPNTSVKVKPAIIAGVLAGTAYQLTQWAWIEGQVFLNRYSVVYGSFAFLPLFLIWLQLSWTILLFGAEFAFAVQHADIWAHEKEKVRYNRKTRRILVLFILKQIICKFEKEDSPMPIEQLYETTAIPRRVIRDIIRDLEETKLIVRVAREKDEESYIPGMALYKLDVFTVYNRLENLGKDGTHQYLDANMSGISNTLNTIDESIRDASMNVLIKDL